jgi:hypothetical protein
MLGDAADTVRYEALDAIGAIGLSGLDAKLADSIVAIVASYLDSPRESMREIASTSLARLGAPALERMILALQSPYEAVAVIATKGLAGLPELPEIDEPLLAALADSRDSVRASASLALVGPGARVEDRLRELARRGPGRRSGAAAAALALIESQRMLDVVDRCYRIEYGMWSPPLPFRTIEGVLPPQTLRFRSLVAYAPMERRPATFVLEQRWREGWVASGWWRPDSVTREIILDASPQLSGVRITVREADAGELIGEARTYWDYRRETEAAPVRVVAIACSSDAGSGR